MIFLVYLLVLGAFVAIIAAASVLPPARFYVVIVGLVAIGVSFVLFGSAVEDALSGAGLSP